MGYTLGLPPGVLVPDHPAIDALVARIRPQNGLILPSSARFNAKPTRKTVMITNLPLDISNDEIVQAVTANLQKRKLVTTATPIVRCDIHKSRFNAFLHMKSQRDAEAAVQLGSVLFDQRLSKIVWAATVDDQSTAQKADYEEIRDNSHSLFVDSLLPVPSLDAIRQSFSQRFQIEELVQPEGFNHCLLFLTDPYLADLAADTLNGTIVDGIKLRVRRSFLHQNEGARGLDQKEAKRAAIAAGPSAMFSVVSPLMRDKPCVADILNPAVQIAVVIRPETERLQESTGRTLRIFNIAPLLTLYDPDVCREIASDVREECQKFGRVADCEIVRLASETLPSDFAVVKVVFEDPDEAKDAQMALAGRRYAGRLVVTQLT
jgi:splicing factor U2AF subunit